MNKNLKKLLRQGFDAPPPAGKEVFLRRAPVLPVNCASFLRAQAFYIRKWVWALSAALFCIALSGACLLKADVLWTLSAFMPLLALALLTESSRSERYGMAELEQSSRFSLKSVTLARLGVLGLENLILVCLMLPFAVKSSQLSLTQTGLYLTCPYLMTSFLGAGMLRRVRDRSANYLCVGIALFVSVGTHLLRQDYPIFYEGDALPWWLLAEILFGAGAAYQYYQILREV